MAAVIVEIADAIVEFLNHADRDWSAGFIAERSQLPIFKSGETPDDTMLAVIPTLRSSELSDRRRRFEMSYGLTLMLTRQAFGPDRDSDDAEDFIAVGEEVIEAIERDGMVLTTASGLTVYLDSASYGDAENGLFSQDMLERYGWLIPFITTSWKCVR